MCYYDVRRLYLVMLTVELDRLLRWGAVGLESWRLLLPQTLAPCDAVKERMCFDVFHR